VGKFDEEDAIFFQRQEQLAAKYSDPVFWFAGDSPPVCAGLDHVDADLYSPVRVGIEELWPKILQGGITVFDKYNNTEWPGETSVLHNMLGNDLEIHSIPFTRQPTAFTVKT